MTEHEDFRERYDSMIWHGIDERLLRKTFGYALHQQEQPPINTRSASQMITEIILPQPENSPLSRDARFTSLRLASHTKTQNKDRGGSEKCQVLLVAIRFQPDAKSVLNMAIEILNRPLMKILRLSEPLEILRPLSVYGIDSLAAIEFRNFVKLELGVELTTLEILNASSLVSVGEKVLQRVTGMSSIFAKEYPRSHQVPTKLPML